MARIPRKPKRKTGTFMCRACRRRFVPEDRRRREHRCPYCDEVTGPRRTISQVRDATWDIFARYIKLRDAELIAGRWMNRCVTCGKLMELGDPSCHAGHYVDGRRKGILFVPSAVHCQCARCNVFLHGNKEQYAIYMVKRYSLDVLEALVIQKNRDAGTWTYEELEQIADHYETLGRHRAAEMGVEY